LNFDSVKIFSYSAQQFAELGLTSVLTNTTPQYGYSSKKRLTI